MPAGATIIGRVAVKVLPDTENFRRDAERELNRIERTLELTVPTKIDMSGASRGYLEELRKINQRNRAQDSRKIKFHTTISRDGMRDAVVTARRQLQALADQKKVTFQADVNANVNSIPVNLNLDQNNLRQVEDKIKDWRDRNSPVKIPVHLDFSSASALATSARLEFLTRPRRVPIIADLDQSSVAKVGAALAALSGLRVLDQAFQSFNTFFRGLDKAIPKISALATGFGGIAASVLASSSNILAFGASLASIAPAALALPGILGGMAIGLGITVAAFKDFNQMMPGVKAQLSALQDIISKNFWDNLQKPLQSMVDTLFPILEKSLAGTSKALGGFFAGLANGVKDVLASKLSSMFDDLDESIRIATTGTDAFVGIITTLGQVGAGYLPRLAQWFVDISTKFNTFLTEASADGRLQQWIDNGITALKDLGRIIGNVAGIFNGLANAAQAAGGSSFAIMADGLERIKNTVNSPVFQNGLTDVFMSAHKAFELLGNTSGPALSDFFLTFGAVLSSILPMVGETIGTLVRDVATALSSSDVSTGVVAMFSGIKTAVQGLTPAFSALAPVVGTVARIIGEAAAAFGPLAAAAIGAVAPGFNAVLRAIQPLIPILAGALTQAFIILGPTITRVGEAIAGIISGGVMPALVNAFNTLLPAITVLAPMIGDVLVTAFQALVPIIPQLVTGFIAFITAIMPMVTTFLPQIGPLIVLLVTNLGTLLAAVLPLIPVFLSFVTTTLIPLGLAILNIAMTAIPAIVNALIAIGTAVAPVVAAFMALWNLIGPILIPVLQFLAQVLISTVVMAINGVTNVISGAVAIITGIVKVFAAFFTGNWSALWNAVKQIASGVWDVIKGAFQIFLSVGILGVFGKVAGVLKGAWTTLWNGIKTLAKGVWDDLVAAFRQFMSTLQATPGAALNAIKTLFSSAWQSIQAALSLAWAAMRNAVSTGISGILTLVSSLPGRITGALGNLGNLLLGAGRAVIDGFIRGITAGFGAVQSKLSQLTSMLPDWKGPMPLDKVILVKSGQAVIEGFQHGLESRYEGIRQSLTGFTKGMSNMDLAVPDINANLNGTVSRAAELAVKVKNAAADNVDREAPKVLNYYAAPGSSLGSEEDLFTASSRARMVGW